MKDHLVGFLDSPTSWVSRSYSHVETTMLMFDDDEVHRVSSSISILFKLEKDMQ